MKNGSGREVALLEDQEETFERGSPPQSLEVQRGEEEEMKGGSAQYKIPYEGLESSDEL